MGNTELGSGISMYTLRESKRYEWKPCEDITTYELALCIPIMMNNSFNASHMIDDSPDSIKRHFKEILS